MLVLHWSNRTYNTLKKYNYYLITSGLMVNKFGRPVISHSHLTSQTFLLKLLLYNLFKH